MRFSSGIASLINFVLLPVFLLIPAFLHAELDINSALVKEKPGKEVVVNDTSKASDSIDLEPKFVDPLLEAPEDYVVEESAEPPSEVAVPDEIPFETDENLNLESEDGENTEEIKKVYEKIPAMDPTLMVRGSPVEEISETAAKEKLKGTIFPEKHPIRRRKFLYRWVLETSDGKRIPLKSNLKLLTLVRKEELLDGPVLLTGYFVQSGMNENLRYFVVDSAVPAGDAGTEPSVKSKSAPKKKKQK